MRLVVRRLCAGLLFLCLTVALLPQTTLADETPVVTLGEPEWNEENGTFSFPQAAITGIGKVNCLTVSVTRGALVSTKGATLTDDAAADEAHRSAMYLLTKDGDNAQSRLRELSFQYEYGMEISVVADGNEINDEFNSKKSVDGVKFTYHDGHYYMYIPLTGRNGDWVSAYNEAKKLTFPWYARVSCHYR